jgi:hypothetical protein
LLSTGQRITPWLELKPGRAPRSLTDGATVPRLMSNKTNWDSIMNTELLAETRLHKLIGLVSLQSTREMAAMHSAIVRMGARVIGIVKMIALARTDIKGIAMAKVIEFHVPKSPQRPLKSVPRLQRGKVIEFCSQTTKSA